MLAACRGVECVFHLAAKVGDFGPSREFFAVNYRGTLNLLQAALAQGVRRIVFVSSLAVHDLRSRPTGFLYGSEDAPLDCKFMPYGRAKALAEEALLEAHRRGDIEVVVVRPALFPFGPGDRLATLPLLRNLRRLWLVDGGRAKMCWTYVENLAHGLALAGEVGRAAGERLVLTDESSVAWRDFLHAFASAMGISRPRWRSVPFFAAYNVAAVVEFAARAVGVRPPLTRYRVLVFGRNCSFPGLRAREVLGFEPIVGKQEAIRRTVEWARPLLDWSSD